MDITLVLVKSITLLYLESKLKDSATDSADVVRKLVEEIKLPDNSNAISDDRDKFQHLRTTVFYLLEVFQNTEIDSNDLLQRLRLNCAGDAATYASFEAVISPEYTTDELKRQVIACRQSINELSRENELGSLIRKMNHEYHWAREKIGSIRDFVAGYTGKLEKFQEKGTKKDPAVVTALNFEDLDLVEESFQEMQSEQCDEGIMKTGWKGLNIMLQGGFRRGEEWVIGALQHKYKTGFTLSVFKQIAIYNKPYLINPQRKPLLLRISFEDTMPQNLRTLYENIYFNKHGEMPKLTEIQPRHMANACMEHLKCNGYYIHMVRVNPSLWTYKDIINYCLALEAAGYEIHLAMLDYLPLVPTTGCQEGPSGFALRDMYRRMRAFFSARKTTLITPHQLSTEAKQLLRDGHSDFLSLIVGKGYYADSKQIDQEVDGELYLHIEEYNKEFFLVVQRGKHRGVPILPKDKMKIILPFPKVGPIIDDLEINRIDLTRLGGVPVRDGGSHEIEEEEMLAF